MLNACLCFFNFLVGPGYVSQDTLVVSYGREQSSELSILGLNIR
jgi:hypothetical protein